MAPRNEISQRFIRDDTLGHGFADGHQEWLLHFAQLRVLAKQVEHGVRNFNETRMVLVVRVHKVFDFSLREFAHAQKTRTRCDFIPETLADLRGGKWKLAAIVIEQVSKVDKDTLGRFGAQETLHCARRADLRREHQVERVRLAQIIIRCRCLGFSVLQRLGHLLGVEFVDARLHILQFAAAIGFEHRVLQQFLHAITEQVIGPVTILGDDIVHHQVGELFDVPEMKREKEKNHTCQSTHVRVCCSNTARYAFEKRPQHSIISFVITVHSAIAGT